MQKNVQIFKLFTRNHRKEFLINEGEKNSKMKKMYKGKPIGINVLIEKNQIQQ